MKLSAQHLAFALLSPVVAACSSPSGPGRPVDTSDLRVNACTGPATSLDPAVVATLHPREANLNGDWANLAESVPGGFAGAASDGRGGLVIYLTDVSQATAAKAALMGAFPERFDVPGAEVRPARWNYAQLDDWRRFLHMRVLGDARRGVNGFGVNVTLNRLEFSVEDARARDRLAKALLTTELLVPLPCDLINITVIGVMRDG